MRKQNWALFAGGDGGGKHEKNRMEKYNENNVWNKIDGEKLK